MWTFLIIAVASDSQYRKNVIDIFAWIILYTSGILIILGIKFVLSLIIKLFQKIFTKNHAPSSDQNIVSDQPSSNSVPNESNVSDEKNDMLFQPATNQMPNEKAQSLLDKAKQLADIINTTIDEKEFYSSFDELIHTLLALKELEGIVSFIGKSPSEMLKEITDNKPKTIALFEQRVNASNLPNDELKVDPYFVDAATFIFEKNIVSIGMIQRYLKIGFNRTVHILDQLHTAGIIGPEEGTKPRKILMTKEEFNSFLNHTTLTEAVYNFPPTTSSPILPSTAIQRIQMYNGKYDYMNGHDFEYFCADLLSHIGYANVKVTQDSGDQGIDILAEKNGVKYAIQCKCYSSDIGNKAVQEAFAGCRYYNCHVPVVMTNRYFTRQAKDLAQKTNVLLWDRNILNKYIQVFQQIFTEENSNA